MVEPHLPTDSQPGPEAGEPAGVSAITNRLARIDTISVMTPMANRVMSPEAAVAPTSAHVRLTPTTAVLRRLHGSDSDELFAAALRDKQDSLLHSNSTPRFTVVGKLGEGSQGIVYRVNDHDCHREVACKVLSYATTDPEEISRFIHEAQITAQLEHPGIVPVHDLGVLRDGTVFYSMKRVDGQSLLDLMQGKAGRGEHRYELLELFLRVCQTAAFAHSRGVVHRDIKPRNIMAGAFGEVLLLDWGLAKVVNCADVLRPMASMRSSPESDPYRTLNGTAVGTPAYMSPEQAVGEVDTLDRRCDIYSLGVILYEMLAGVSPYVRGEARKVMHQVSHALWSRLDRRSEGRGLPPPLIAITHRAMAFDRRERYQTVEELAGDLRAFLAGQAVSAYRERPAERLIRLVGNHRRQVRTGVSVAMAAAAIAVAVWLWVAGESRHRIELLHSELAGHIAHARWDEARSTSNRLLELSKYDPETLLQEARIVQGLRQQEAQRREAERRQEAANLVRDAEEDLRSQDISVLKRAVERYLRALGLVSDDARISAAYQAAAKAVNDAELREKTELEAGQRRQVLAGLLAEGQRAADWARKRAEDRAQLHVERRTVETLGESEPSPEQRARLHAIETRIDSKDREYFELQGRAMRFFDQAVALDPVDRQVRMAVADYHVQRLLEMELRGNAEEALMAEHRSWAYNDGRYNDLLHGDAWVQAEEGGPSLLLLPLEENADRLLVPQAVSGSTVAPGAETTVTRGRYLVQGGGLAVAINLMRGSHRKISLTTPAIPPGVAFIPPGEVIDREGYVVAVVPAYGLAQREVTCGEYLVFLNDPASLALVDAAVGTALVPRDGSRALWRRSAEGRFALESVDGAGVIDPAWPMAWITVSDALAYAAWRANRDHLSWRLPTLDEWQLAVQGGDGRHYPWGLRGDPVHCASAFTVANGVWCASAVGSHPADRSVQGVFDLGGSLAEMVADAAIGVDAKRARLAAGGSFLDRQAEQFGVHSLRSIDRSTPSPTIGFRLALSLPSSR